ncbi:MAG: hypothetical protein DCF15_18370 [Phormidesmis priestleyi]|uniref:histidine kinase n=1 Tax=Phormidesmis priestleyi TaxID=268141 RepID=A0A2W4WS36_9CYAN|nr:MAG: hypothetical protein DCF15_18370 [Phormidesmis priestleyi]
MKDLSTGEIGTLVSAYDWSQTPLGAAETWSAELQAAVELLVIEIDRAKTSSEDPHPSLFKAQQRHDTLLNEMDKGFVIFEMLFDSELKPVDYRYLETNSLFEPITGLKDVIGKTALEIMPDIEPFWIETYGKVVLTGESVLIEHEVKAMKSWFEVKAFPIDAPQEFRFGVLFTDITDRKLAQERVKLIQERLEISLAAGDVGVWDLDLVSKQAWRSIEHDRIFGYDLLLPEWNYAMFLSHVIPRDREWVNAEFETAIANHTNWEVECCIQRIDGETSWIWTRAASEYNDKGEPVRMYGVVKNVSDRKRQELNNKFLAEIQKDLVILSDPTEIMSVVGEKIRCFFSFSILAFIDINTATNEAMVVYNNRDADILDSVSTHSLGDYLSEIHLGKLKAGQTITIDDVTTDPEIKDGGAAYEIYQVRSVIHSPHLSNGQWKFMLGCHRREPSNWRADEVELIDELTARLYLRISRTRAEQALSESEARFRDMADTAPVLIWMSGTDKLCNYFNQPWLDYAGRTLEQEMGNGWAEGVYADDLQFCLDTYFTAFDAREPFRMEYRFRRFDGQYRWFVDTAHPRFTPEGEFLGYIGSCLDIEDLKRRELNSNFLAEIQKDLAVIEDIDQIMDVVGEKIRLWFDSSIVAFADVDVAADEARTFNTNNDSDIPNAVGIHRLSEYHSDIALQQLKAGQKVAISDVRAEPNIKDNGIAYESWQILSSVSIPYISDGQLKFLMGVHRRVPSVWREDELELMGELILRIYIEIERIRSEAALAKANQRFEAATQAVEGIIFEWSMDTNFVFRSNGLFNLIGVEAKDAPPTSEWWFNLIHPEDQPNIESFFTQIENGQDRYQYEYRVLHTDGRWIDVWEKGKLKRNGAGKIVELVGFISDISDRKRVEEALQHSEEFKNRVLESSSDCIKVLDLNAQLLYMNIGGMGLLEIDDLTPYLNSEWLCFWESEQRQAAEAAFTAAKSGEIGKFQGFCATVKGNPKWWDVVVTPIRDGAGQVVQILSTSRDITEQKRAEEELRQKNAILDVINKCVPTPIFVKDRQGRIIYANPATLTALGKTAAEVIGRYDSDLYSSPEDAVRVMENDQRIMSSGQMEVVEESADGINIFLVMKAPYYNEAGEVIGLVGISYDTLTIAFKLNAIVSVSYNRNKLP